ncbi:MAG: type II secretion system protein [Sarcina sp.]
MTKKKGATLLEVVIALAIISIMMVPIMNSVLQSVKLNKKSEDLKGAKLIGQQVVEHLRNQEVIKEGQILRLNNNELEISSRSIQNEFNVESLGEINGFNVEGVITRESEIQSSKYYDVEVGGFLIVDKNDIYYKEATSDYKTFTDFYTKKTSSSNKVREINSDLEVKIHNNEITFTEGSNKFWSSKMNNSSDSIALIIHDKSDHKITINNTGADINLYGFRSNKISSQEGFINEKVSYIGNKIKRVENILYDYEHRTKGLYSINLEVSKDEKVIESLEYQFNVGGSN